eukprot:SAG25_NODE_8667_length_410_cov_0.813505_1_plen_25_part_10
MYCGITCDTAIIGVLSDCLDLVYRK